MARAFISTCLLGGLIWLSGCASVRNAIADRDRIDSARPPQRGLRATAGCPFESEASESLANNTVAAIEQEPATQTITNSAMTNSGASSVDHHNPPHAEPLPQKLLITPVGHEVRASRPSAKGTVTIDGRQYDIRLVGRGTTAHASDDVHRVHTASQQTPADNQFNPAEDAVSITAEDGSDAVDSTSSDAILLNLPSALSMVGGDHPAVGLARWKVQEAYANLDQADVLWLPNIQTGFSFHRHDGNYQASNGSIVDVNRSSFQFGLGAGATGAGTTPRPGIVAQFHLADAIFEPDIAQKTAWATCHAEKATVNRQLRDVALAYLSLLKAHQNLRILEEVRARTHSLSEITDNFAAAGQGLRADADRLRTELTLVEGRISSAREDVDLSSARLGHALSTDSRQPIVPLDPTVVPINLVSTDLDKAALISSGLASRPELKELQALVAAACDRYRRQRYAPFVPSVLLGFSQGGFGGATGTAVRNVNDRYDFDALVAWEIRNFGFGERAARQRTQAQLQQAMYRKVSLMDDVAREITESHAQVVHRRERVNITQSAIQSALDSYDRNLSRIRDGEGLPIEVLQSVKALEAARLAYLDSVIAYNEAQFQLQWSLGWQVSAPAELQ